MVICKQTWLVLFGLALLYTLLNCIKPLHIDDPAHYYYAVQIVEHPLDPYGFTLCWYQEPEPANHILTPLVADYWWALALKLFGEEPWLWKLWLWPFSMLFVSSFYLLCLRFAPGLEWLMLVMTVLSPLFLPSLNLMLDVPALALSLTSIVLFMRACEGGSLWQTVLAGALAALAMQTKYTAFLAPTVIGLYGLLFGRFLLGVAAAALAAMLFASWEWVIALKYGESHFLYHLHDASGLLPHKYLLLPPLLGQLGGVTPALSLLGLAALRCRPKTIAWVGLVILLGYLLVMLIPERFAALRWVQGSISQRFAISDAVFGGLGVLLLGTVLLALWRLVPFHEWPLSATAAGKAGRLEWFCLLWLVLEIAGYFAMSPFPAARRGMGIVLVSTLILGRLAAQTCQSPARRAILRGVALGGVILGFGFYAQDLDEAYAPKQAAEEITRRFQPWDGGKLWYVGHWGFQYYAEHVGMRPVVPGVSQLRAGDYLVIPEERISQQSIALPRETTELVGQYRKKARVPLCMVPFFYGGGTPLVHSDADQFTVFIYRVTADFTAEDKTSD